MDSSFTVKPRDSLPRVTAGRSNIVRTDLSPSISVNASDHSASPHQGSESMTRDPALDPQCQRLLDREREQRERRRRARKDEAMMRQKAYGSGAAAVPEPSADGQPHADFQV